MSEGKDTETDFDAADDRLFSGKPLEELDADTVVTIEAEAEDGFEQPVEQPTPQETQAQPNAQPEANDDEGLSGLPPAAIAAIKDERKKRQAATGELQSMRDELNQLKGRVEAQPAPQQQQTQQQGPQIPNPATDPEGFAHFFLNMLDQQAGKTEATNRLNQSRFMAMQAHGVETVQKAEAAFYQMEKTNPQQFAMLHDAFGRSADPIGEISKWYQQQQLMTEIGDDPEAYKQKLREELIAEMGGQPQPGQQQLSTPQTAPNLPPRVANTPGALPGGSAQHTMDDAEANLWGR